MSELSFEQMFEESLKTIRTGEIVTGKVIDVKEDEIVLNIGYKSDGIIPKSEYTNEANVDLRTQVQVGDEMEAKVVKVNDTVLQETGCRQGQQETGRGFREPRGSYRKGCTGTGRRLKRCC